MISLKNVTFQYAGTEGLEGVFDLNLDIKNGEVIVLCGQSGCGKTTLVLVLVGLTRS